MFSVVSAAMRQAIPRVSSNANPVLKAHDAFLRDLSHLHTDRSVRQLLTMFKTASHNPSPTLKVSFSDYEGNPVCFEVDLWGTVFMHGEHRPRVPAFFDLVTKNLPEGQRTIPEAQTAIVDALDAAMNQMITQIETHLGMASGDLRADQPMNNQPLRNQTKPTPLQTAGRILRHITQRITGK